MDNLNQLSGWPNKVKVMQKNWIENHLVVKLNLKSSQTKQ